MTELDVELYRRMLLIRRFEDAVQSLFLKGEVHGTTHLYSGQEASAVGVCSALRPGTDRVAGTYRGHGHALGVDEQALMDELLGRSTGVCGGRAGSMNVIDLERGLMGCYGIVGGSIAAATGAALASKLTGDGGVAVAFFGDGTSNQAYFSECLNFARVERLPLLFLCENNLYMEFTPIEDVTAGAIEDRPRALGIPTEVVDGNDVWAVRDATQTAVDATRSGAGPAFLMTMTYRFVGHSRSDPGRYRKPGELDAWKARDPLVVGRRRLEDELGVDAAALDAVEQAVDARLAEVVERSLAAPWPDVVPATEFKGGARMSDTIEFRHAIRAALDEELARDERVFLFGEDVAKAGGVFAVTAGLHETHGKRVFDTPISELALMGAAYGSAVSGLRPVLEIMFGDFLPLVMDGLVNQAAKFWYISNEQAPVPLVIRSAVGGGGRFGAIHSQMPAAWFQNVPGLKVVAPSTPADAKALLKAAIRDDNPVLFLEHKRLYSLKGPVGEDELLPLGRAHVVRSGSDLTLVTAMRHVHDAVEAADALAADGLTVEVIDVRTIRPLDVETILESVARTNRLLVVDESPRSGGWGAEVLASVTERALDELDDVWRIAAPDQPIPYSPPLEDDFFPSASRIVAAVRARLGVAAAR